MNTDYRADLSLDDMPAGIRALRVARGYPVPAFVVWLKDGTPEFRAMSPVFMKACINKKLCWVCGQPTRSKLGFKQSTAFVIGPMCAVNRIASEPFSHLDCAIWSAKNCPFLARPHAVRREGMMPEDLIQSTAGIAIARNPGVTLVWPTSSYTYAIHGGGPLFSIGPLDAPPLWFCEGRTATRAEIVHSIETGLPALEGACRSERPEDVDLAFEALHVQVAIAMKLVPATD